MKYLTVDWAIGISISDRIQLSVEAQLSHVFSYPTEGFSENWVKPRFS